MAEHMLTRLEWMVGTAGIDRLRRASVALFGCGGVGGFALEALVRSGVGRIVVIDGDAVTASNVNRQIIATSQTIGRRKTDLAKERALAINPDVIIEVHDIIYTAHEYPDFIESLQIDYVIDAIDMVSSKIHIVETCQRLGIPVISCMGGGNRLHPEQLEITDISKTYMCPLAKVMRKELRKRGITKQTVLFSTEPPIKPVYREEGTKSPASCAFVPSVAGLMLAGYVVREFLEVPDHEKSNYSYG